MSACEHSSFVNTDICCLKLVLFRNNFNPVPLPNPNIRETVSQPKKECTDKMLSHTSLLRDLFICLMSQILDDVVFKSEVKIILSELISAP